MEEDRRSLSWDGRKGYAVFGDVAAAFDQAPRIPGLPAIAEIDYLPRVRAAMVREQGKAWRTLTLAEQNKCDAMLARMGNRVIEVITGG